MQIHYVIISLLVVALTMIVLVRLYKRRVHLEKMANYYRDRLWWKEPEDKIYIKIEDDPLEEIGYISGEKIERRIENIIKRFKKDPELLKETERSYYEWQRREAIKHERNKN